MWIKRAGKDPDQSTPQAALDGFKQAMERKDWRLALRYMSPKAQQGLVGALLMGSGYAADGDAAASAKLVKIMHKHGLRKHRNTDIANVDNFLVVRDLMRWSDRCLPADRQLDLLENVAKTEFSNYRISDDRAYVIATCDERKSETRLQQIDDRWYLI